MIALLGILAVAASQEPALVPETPADWRGERLEFPLDFAPDIPLEGVEELRFAPGMFAPDSETHWTYLFGLDVRGPEGAELDVDEAFLEDFLLRYYRGLCGAVGEARGLDVDLERVLAEVTGGGASFHAEVELFDTFADGAPLALELDFLVHPKSKGVELLGLASPEGAGEAVRAELGALGEAWRAARPVPIFLNHVYMVPDLATYEALAASELLREIALVEERTTRREDLEYTGLYLYGEHTYLEFLKPDAAAGLVPGSTGVAFGVELPGGLARVAPLLEAAGVRTFAGKKTRDFEGVQVPWFDVLGFEAATTTQRLQLFAMEYDPVYLQRWHPPAEAEPVRIDREAVLARTEAVLGGPGNAASGDIARVVLMLDGTERDRFAQIVRKLGMDSEPAEGTWCWGPTPNVDHGVQFEVMAIEESLSAPGGVGLVELDLSRPMKCAHSTSHDSDFGQVHVQVSDRSAKFSFFDGLPPKERK